jgi:histidinol phosphatase-like PHP family hydrolase
LKNPLIKIDLHVHTSERSECAGASEEEQILASIAAGLDAIAITDHARLVPQKQLRALNRRYAPFQVFGGVEITTEDEDVLVFGVHDDRLEKPDWSYPELHAFVRSQQGYIVLAHPFRFHDEIKINLDEYPPDALEVYSANTPSTAEEAIRAMATRLNLSLLSNSDAHNPGRLGTYYNLLPRRVRNEAELIGLLKGRQFTLHRQKPKIAS